MTAQKYILLACGLGASYFVYKKFFRRMISGKGLEFLKSAEGFKNRAYKDVKGLWTIGVGHLIDLVKEGHLLTKVLTESEVKSILDKDLDRFEAVVKSSIKVPIKQYQRDALVNLAFNIGETAFKNSTLVKKINAKAPLEEIRKAFAMWNKPYQIVPRRAKEIRLYLTGNYDHFITNDEVLKYMA
jgi:lysozyme